MTGAVVVIGAGIGGLSGAIRLAQAGFDVHLFEARNAPGGLASGVRYGDFTFDAGPYILLDRPGLEWSFQQLGLNLAEQVELLPIGDIYDVTSEDTSIRFHSNLNKTADGFERQWRGSGRRYSDFVMSMERIYKALRPMLQTSRPGLLQLIRTGGWRHARFLTKALGEVLDDARLPAAVSDAIAIWTYVAGQVKHEAPSPMAFVPVLMHQVGAYYPKGGIRAISETLEGTAVKSGVHFHYGTKVSRIRVNNGKVEGIETSAGDIVHGNAVLSDCAALTVYAQLLPAVPPAAARLKDLPLQSPGVCAYLAVRGHPSPPYLRFKLDKNNRRCRLLIQPAVVDPSNSISDWLPARLMSPMNYEDAQRLGPTGQLDYLDRLLDETWWQESFSNVQVLAKRTPRDWGAGFHLYEDSMNPVMTARFMRRGRIAHRSPWVGGLYHAGSSTHPGQWISFCMISGILAANSMIKDHR